MTGSGTSTNPYLVQTYNDFLSMTGGIDKYYKLGCDIDFAQQGRSPDANSIKITLKQLDGNGHTLKNFFKREDSANNYNSLFYASQTSNFTIKNLNFTGIYLAGGVTQLIQATTTFVLNNCKIGVKIIDTYNGSNIYPLLATSNPTDCEILLEGQSKRTKAIADSTSSSCGNVVGCLIKLNLTIENADFTTAVPILGKDISFTGILGEVKCLNLSGANYQLSVGKNLCCYYALKFNPLNSELSIGSFEGTNFYDKEVMADIIDKMPVNYNFHALTTEQCKSVEYLQSIDFPCISGDIL